MKNPFRRLWDALRTAEEIRIRDLERIAEMRFEITYKGSPIIGPMSMENLYILLKYTGKEMATELGEETEMRVFWDE